MQRYAIVVVAVGFACGGGGASNAPATNATSGIRDTKLEHESCSGDGPREDANGDGKPDIQRVTKDGREVCRIADLDYDGKPEQYSYFNERNELRRRETDLDNNGVPNMVDHFEQGKLVIREIDAANQGKIDTWEVYDPQTGKRIRRERDQNGDGRIDQWWTYDGDKVTISADKNEDGQPDPESALLWGPQGLAPANVAAEPSAVPAASTSAPRIEPPSAPTTAPSTAPSGMLDAGPPTDAGPRRTKR